MRRLVKTLAILFAWLGCTGLAVGQASDPLTGIPAESLDQIKLIMEARLKDASGHPILCKDEVKECIQSYNSLLSLDWKRSGLEPDKKLIVSQHLPTTAKPDYYVINTHETPEVLKRFLSADLDSSASFAVETLQLLQDFQQSSQLPCPDRAVAVAPLPCPEKEKYYDDYFKNDEFNATIAWGYFDEHDDNFLGYLTEQLFKTRKVAVYTKENDEEIHQMIELLQSQGFQIESSGASEWHLSRPFFYKGNKKIAKVHLYSSTVKCAGETEEDGIVHRYDNKLCPEQKIATALSQKAFSNAAGKHQLLVYNGHSRLGRGPDFGPLGIKAGKFSIAKGALKNIDLDNTKTLLYLSSCDSLKYFQKSIAEKQKTLRDTDALKFLGITGDSAWKNSAYETNTLIKMLLETRCPRDIVDAINLPKPDDSIYQIDFDEVSNWMKGGHAPAQLFRLEKDSNGLKKCHTIRADGTLSETPTDDHFCADRFKAAKSVNGNLNCYLANENDIPFGEPLAADLCKE